MTQGSSGLHPVRIPSAQEAKQIIARNAQRRRSSFDSDTKPLGAYRARETAPVPQKNDDELWK